MRLPVISEYSKGSNEKRIADIISYLRRLVRELQSYIDKNNTVELRYVTKINIKSGWLTVTYNDNSSETHKID